MRSIRLSIYLLLGIVLFFTPLLMVAQTAMWQQTDFPHQYGGSIDAIHVSPNGSIFAATYPDGLVRSTDDGETWEQVVQGNEEYGSGGDRIASTSSGHVFAYINYQLMRSTDNGANWTYIGLSEWMYSVNGITINSNNDIFVSVFGAGMFRSTDDGESWIPINNGLPDQSSPDQVIISKSGMTETLFLPVYDNAASQKILYRSTSNGDVWTALISQSYISNLFVHPNGNIFFEGPAGLMRSIDNGNRWQAVPNPGYSHLMLFMPNGEIWSMPGSGIRRSTDNGLTWTDLGAPATSEVMTIARSQNGSVFIGTYRTGIFKTSDNALTWQQANTGLPKYSPQITAITGRQGGVLFTGTSQYGNYFSTNSGATWTRNYPGSLNVGRLAAHPDGLLFCANGTLFVSEDDGNNWQYQSTGAYAEDVTIDKNGTIYSCGRYKGVQRSTDLGWSWNQIPCPGMTYPRMHVTQNGTIVVLTPYTEPDPERTWNYIRTSTDGGSTWIGALLSNASAPVYEFTSTSNGYLFVASSIGVYRSTDSGLNWYPTNNGLTTSDIRSLAINSFDYIFAGTANRGVFRSTDYGYSWEPFNSGLTDTTITSLYCDVEGNLYAGGWNNGIFRTNTRPTYPNPHLSVLQPGITIKTFSGQPKESTVAIRNDGLQPVVISTVSVSDTRFSILRWPASLAPQASDSISIRFNTSVPETIFGSAIVFSNSTTSTDTISIRGEAIAGAKLTLSRTSINFGEVPTHSTVTDTITLWNSGNMALSFGEVHINRPILFEISQLPSTIAEQGSIVATVTFNTPYTTMSSYPEPLWDTITVYSNSLTTPDRIALLGYFYDSGTSIPSDPSIPTDYYVKQNYPNPFNGTTRIEFGIVNSAFVTLKVYDMTGREIATVVNQELGPGFYERTLNANGLASGVYLYRLQAGSFFQTKKLLLIR
jgi:photosystem II stability/assembly factor-like uncharacterized protein